MDTAFKPTLRGSRKSIRDLFFAFVEAHPCRFKQNRYRWSDDELKDALTEFMQTLQSAGDRKNEPFTDEQIWTVGLLVFPNKGSYSEEEDWAACPPLFNALGKQGISKFRDLFGENTTKQVEEFLQSDLIQRIWPIIKENLTIEHCFDNLNKKVEGAPYAPKINPNFRLSYKKLATQMQDKFKLSMPSWYCKEFNLSEE